MLGLQADLESSTVKLNYEKDNDGDLEEKLAQECASETVFIFSIISKF